MAVKTYSFRYRPTTAPSGTEDRVLACSHTTDACHCVINSSGQIGYYVSGSFTQLGTKTQTIDNIWHSYIVEKDEIGNGCIYVDGQKIGCATNFPTDNVNQIGNFKTELKPEIGRKPKVGLKPRGVSNIYTRPCCGDIDEIAYFDRQLSASEIVDLAQSGSLSKVYTLADYKITAMADDNIIATTEKPRYSENWRSIWDADQRTTALPTAIGSITVNGSYKSLANAANSAGIWTPTTSGTAAYDYYQAVENWRQMYFVSSGNGTGFLLTSQLGVDTDISSMSPTFEARQSALMFAEDALRSSVMIKRQQIAESVANLKTTLFQNIELAKASAKAGDAFMYSGNVYICNTALAATATRSTSKNWGNAPTAPAQTTQTVSGCVLTEPLVNGDTYFNTGNAKWYKYTGSWEVDTANGIAIVTYTPKYLGRYYQSHPDLPNNGDWWLVYGLASSPVTRGFWYNNNGTKTLVSTLGTEAQRKYKGSGLEDILYASNNGYALTSGGEYDPVAVYGVNTMDLLAVNQAFIKKLVSQSIEFENSISSIEGGDFELGDNRVFMGRDSADVFSLLFQTLIGKAGTEKFWSNIYKLYGDPQNAIQEFRGNSYVDGGVFSGYGSVWSAYAPPPSLAFPHTVSYGFVTRSATMGVAYVPLWGITIVRLNFNGNLNLFVSTDYGNTYPLNANKVFTVPIDIMVTCAKNYGNFLYVGTTGGLYMISSNVSVGSAVVPT